jgi:hypothetical protein
MINFYCIFPPQDCQNPADVTAALAGNTKVLAWLLAMSLSVNAQPLFWRHLLKGQAMARSCFCRHHRTKQGFSQGLLNLSPRHSWDLLAVADPLRKGMATLYSSTAPFSSQMAWPSWAGANFIIWDKMLSSGANVIMWD